MPEKGDETIFLLLCRPTSTFFVSSPEKIFAQIFDKRYYEEFYRRAWVPRNANDPNIQDWTWGNPNNNGSPRFMLNTDMCLLYDIKTTFPCCTNNETLRQDGTNACDGGNQVLSDTPCGVTASRGDAANAVDLFAQRREQGGFLDNNAPFYDAFAAAWSLATTNGWTNLRPLSGCVPTDSPTSAPSRILTKSPTAAPVTPEPTNDPTTPSPVASCVDVESLVHNGIERDCAWVGVGTNDRCRLYAHICPVTCDECDCLLNNRVCSSDDDCCSNTCIEGSCACRKKNNACNSGDQCCSGVCRDNNTCAGQPNPFNP